MACSIIPFKRLYAALLSNCGVCWLKHIGLSARCTFAHSETSSLKA